MKFTCVYKPSIFSNPEKENIRYYTNGRAVSCTIYGKKITKMFESGENYTTIHEKNKDVYKTTIEFKNAN